jgi:hypothetical protein
MIRKLLGISAGAFLLIASTAQADLATGLVAYWNMNGNGLDTAGGIAGSADTTADNGINQGPAGSQAYSTVTPSPVSGYYSKQDGAGGYLDAGNLADVNISASDLTISAWFRVDAFDAGWQGLVAHGEGDDYRIARRGSNNWLAFAGGTGDIEASSAPVDDGLWHHVLATSVNGGGTELWIDGVSEATGAGPATIGNNGTPTNLFIGANPESANRDFNGGIDDVAIWSRVLTPGEISNIYNGGLVGTSVGVWASIPEPSSLALTLLGAIGLIRLRKR